MKPFNVFPYDSNIDFMRMRWVSLTVALLLMVALGAMGTRGFNFALDFTGGIGVELRYDKAPDVEQVREQLATAGFHGAQVQNFGSGPLKGFGMTTMLGIATSAYTAVSVSRGIATLIYGGRKKLKSVAI